MPVSPAGMLQGDGMNVNPYGDEDDPMEGNGMYDEDQAL